MNALFLLKFLRKYISLFSMATRHGHESISIKMVRGCTGVALPFISYIGM